MRIRYILSTEEDFSSISVGKESTCNAGDPGLIPGSRRPAREGIGYPLQYSWVPLMAQLVKNLSAIWDPWVGKIPWRREQLPTPVFWPGKFHGVTKNPTKRRSLSHEWVINWTHRRKLVRVTDVYIHIFGGENCNPLQCPCLEKPMDRAAWPTTVHVVTKSRTWPRDFHFNSPEDTFNKKILNSQKLVWVSIIKEKKKRMPHI